MVRHRFTDLAAAPPARGADNTHVTGRAVPQLVSAKLPLLSCACWGTQRTEGSVAAAFAIWVVEIGVTAEPLRAACERIESIALGIWGRWRFFGTFGFDVGAARSATRLSAAAPARPPRGVSTRAVGPAGLPFLLSLDSLDAPCTTNERGRPAEPKDSSTEF